MVEFGEEGFVVEYYVFDSLFGGDSCEEVVRCDDACAWVGVDDEFVEC